MQPLESLELTTIIEYKANETHAAYIKLSLDLALYFIIITKLTNPKVHTNSIKNVLRM